MIEEHRQELLDAPRQRWKTESYLVRCLIKLKRTDEAVQQAEGIAKRTSGDRVLLVLAHASSGGAQQTIAAVHELEPPRYSLLGAIAPFPGVTRLF